MAPAVAREGDTSLGMDSGFGEVAEGRPAGYWVGSRIWVWGHGCPAVLQSRAQSPIPLSATSDWP